MRELLLFADEKEQELRKKIWEGYIEAKPYKKGQFSQCAYCPYQSVCGFDARIKGAKYRYYPKKKPEEIIASIEMRLNGGNDGDVQDQEGS